VFYKKWIPGEEMDKLLVLLRANRIDRMKLRKVKDERVDGPGSFIFSLKSQEKFLFNLSSAGEMEVRQSEMERLVGVIERLQYLSDRQHYFD
jgi:hypothetical protein